MTRVDFHRLYQQAQAVDERATNKVAADFVHLRISTWEYADRLNKIIARGRRKRV